MKIALTFDDGPSSATTRILNTLQQNEGRVTFFVMGSKVEEQKGKIFRAAQMGCEVLCHAWDHQRLTNMHKNVVKKQLYSTVEAIATVTGTAAPLFRPPYGEYDEKLGKITKKLGLSMINWSLDTRDWDHKDSEIVYSTIMNKAKDGDVVLCHDVYDSTAEAMSRVIPELISRGFELVPVTELIRERFGELIPGKMYYDPDYGPEPL